MTERWPVQIALKAARFGFLHGRIDHAILRQARAFFLFAAADAPAEVLSRRLPGDISFSRADGFVFPPGAEVPSLGVAIRPAAPPPALRVGGICFELDRASPFFTPSNDPAFRLADGVVPDPNGIVFLIHVPDTWPGLRLELWAWSADD